MSEISAFRGASGEVVRAFVSPATLLTMVPTAIASVVCSVLAGLVAGGLDLPPAAALPLMVAAGSPVVGLFAMSARAGHLGAGFFECLSQSGGAAMRFTVRHALLAVAWAVPLALVAGALGGRAGRAALGGPAALASGGMILGVAAVLLLATIAPCLALLVATRADTVGEAFSAETWGWVLGHRRPDLPAFFASGIGGMVLFALVAWPIGGLAVAVLATTAPELAAVVGVAVYAAPAAASPVLIGRLAGAFAAGDYLEIPGARATAWSGPTAPAASPQAPSAPPSPASSSRPSGATAPLGPDAPTAPASAAQGAPHPGTAAAAAPSAAREAPASAAAPVTSKPMGATGAPPSVARCTADIEAALESEPEKALELVEALAAREPRNASVAALRARVLTATGRTDVGREAAGSAIRLALQGGAPPVALEVFRAHSRDAHRLGLGGDDFCRLGRVLVNASERAAATWCFRAAHRLGAQPMPVQKGLVAVIEAARAAGDEEAARKACDTFLAEHAESAFAEHVRLWREELEPAGVA